jgi:hypothetical protein
VSAVWNEMLSKLFEEAWKALRTKNGGGDDKEVPHDDADDDDVLESSSTYSILFEVAYRPSNSKSYFLLPKTVSLNDALRSKIVIEYPELLIVRNDELSEFSIVTSSSESFEARGVLQHERFNVLNNISQQDKGGGAGRRGGVDIAHEEEEEEVLMGALDQVLMKDLKK